MDCLEVINDFNHHLDHLHASLRLVNSLLVVPSSLSQEDFTFIDVIDLIDEPEFLLRQVKNSTQVEGYHGFVHHAVIGVLGLKDKTDCAMGRLPQVNELFDVLLVLAQHLTGHHPLINMAIESGDLGV